MNRKIKYLLGSWNYSNRENRIIEYGIDSFDRFYYRNKVDTIDYLGGTYGVYESNPYSGFLRPNGRYERPNSFKMTGKDYNGIVRRQFLSFRKSDFFDVNNLRDINSAKIRFFWRGAQTSYANDRLVGRLNIYLGENIEFPLKDYDNYNRLGENLYSKYLNTHEDSIPPFQKTIDVATDDVIEQLKDKNTDFITFIFTLDENSYNNANNIIDWWYFALDINFDRYTYVNTIDVTIVSEDYESLSVENAEITIYDTDNGNITKTTDVNGETVFELEDSRVYNYSMRYGGILHEGSIVADSTQKTIQFGISINKLVRYWSSDKASRFTVSNDQIESIADVTQGALASQSTGDYRPAYTLDDGVRSIGDFDGNDWLDSGITANRSSDQSRTYAFWFKGSNTGNIEWIYGTRNGSLNNNYEFGFYGDNSFRVYIDGASQRLAPLSVDKSYRDGNWHQAMIIIDNNNGHKIYMDGNLEASINKNLGDFENYDNNYIGARNLDVEPNPFIGNINDFKIWNKSLTSTEITNDYNYGLKIHPNN